ncbi:hypothetical protein H5410_002537 [Solanum commersonii]|uniref:Uncharacterized protein n=1 Tax=Solanum commersonii TaxID=4109 RepID=A0A9J6B2E7_SOLCO|nr:hypothetical protein H5410_002537 [Solanum commersonii]
MQTLKFQASHQKVLNLIECSRALKEKVKSAMKRSSRHVDEQFYEATLYRPMPQNARMLKAKAKRR